MNRKATWFDYVNVLILMLVVVICLYPFIYMIAVSMSGGGPISQGKVWLYPVDFNLDMYRYVFEDGRILTGYKNTLIYVALGTACSLLVTVLGAYPLSKKQMVFQKPIMLMIVLTMFINGGMIPTFLVVRGLGLLDSIWAMVLPGLISTWNLIIMRTFFLGIPKELEESAKVDGLSDIGILFKIVLPISQAVIASVGLFYAVGIWNGFMSPLLYLRSEELYPLQLFLRNIVLSSEMTGSGAPVSGNIVVVEPAMKYAAIIISTLPILCVYPFLQKYFVKGVTLGSVKG
ncbi:carbohydrate ABC transporter permease [Paenibacillus sp. KQZ6P-2]|uniref:Carbohydrate ABC transporter permease n=1 Tax=Paenibacillus mangrovi TaxID=2931978 RepID=A0A9X1WW08_9BACL|nr:carbohydrate ABC transporter permease [Paenibacillus mangrovi]MCJ8012979.1 carbohydrate ABC transporter permease [Paenibacillus mangrovi]